jgi:DNA-binding NarL/FixJ family response regulator
MAAPTRIFLVDDHPLVREWLASLLHEQPDLVVCGDAEEPAAALSAIVANPPDVVIVDLSFTRGSGIELIKSIRERAPSCQVIVLSMHEEDFIAERALRAGARAYVTKRESTGKIVEAIREVLMGRVYANTEILARLAGRLAGRAPAHGLNAVESLSERELDVFRRLGKGHTTRRVAADMGVSMKTVQAYCARMKEKLGLANGAELVREAVRWAEQEYRN